MSDDLRAQRDRLLEKFTIMQADLGGAFYEMAIRDHVRMDVLTRKAAELQRVDAELLAVERMLELDASTRPGSARAAALPTAPRSASAPSAGTAGATRLGMKAAFRRAEAARRDA